MKPAIGCVVALARCAGIALRTTPDRVDRFDAMKWVSIYEGWYEVAHMIRKGQFQTAGHSAFQQFSVLAV
ncbi:hypothetical protein [Roseibium sp.]|uniref:hypothetical protein n=1 Tax=Roseibium sp. TaxID=1936156 RepID=UPI003BA9F8B8